MSEERNRKEPKTKRCRESKSRQRLLRGEADDGLFAGIRLRKPLHYNSLTVFPLSWTEPQELPYVLLEKAIEGGLAVVEEVNEAGRVPNLAVTNRADRPLLIPEGEVLVGAKQNRVVNVTVLVAPNVKFILPVSCVEAGRWRYQARYFRSQFCAPPSLRVKKMKAVQRHRAAGGEAKSDQAEVWDEVEACLKKANAHSRTSSLTDGYLASQKRLEEFRREFPLPEDAAGVLVARGTRVIGMDLFDCPATFLAMWKRLRDAYFFEALDDARPRGPTAQKTARAFLHRVAAAVRPRASALGLGEEYEIVGDGLVGSALTYSGRVCHVAAFTETR